MSSAAHAYGQGHAESVVRSQQWRTVANSAAYLSAELRPGRTVLDIGCGPGTVTVDIARFVAPATVTGLDVTETVLDQARALAAQSNVDNVEFVIGDVNSLRLPDASFDIVHAHQVLLHLRDPIGALREMLRVTKPGGVVAVRDTDYLGAMWYPEDPRLDRWLAVYRAVAHANGANPEGGRKLLAWAHAAGARNVHPSASIWCHSTPEDRAWWGGMWAERILDSRIAEQALAGGHATRDELREISNAWTEWAANPDGFFTIPHGEILCRK